MSVPGSGSGPGPGSGPGAAGADTGSADEAAEAKRQRQAELREAFDLFDKNKDGSISVVELKIVLRSLGLCPTESELEDMISMADKDHDMQIDFEEFCALMETHVQPESDTEDLRAAFQIFDTDGNGTVSIAELERVLTTLGEKMTRDEVRELTRELGDQVKDGGISIDAFVQLLSLN